MGTAWMLMNMNCCGEWGRGKGGNEESQISGLDLERMLPFFIRHRKGSRAGERYD